MIVFENFWMNLTTHNTIYKVQYEFFFYEGNEKQVLLPPVVLFGFVAHFDPEFDHYAVNSKT